MSGLFDGGFSFRARYFRKFPARRRVGTDGRDSRRAPWPQRRGRCAGAAKRDADAAYGCCREGRRWSSLSRGATALVAEGDGARRDSGDGGARRGESGHLGMSSTTPRCVEADAGLGWTRFSPGGAPAGSRLSRLSRLRSPSLLATSLGPLSYLSTGPGPAIPALRATGPVKECVRRDIRTLAPVLGHPGPNDSGRVAAPWNI